MSDKKVLNELLKAIAILAERDDDNEEHEDDDSAQRIEELQMRTGELLERVKTLELQFQIVRESLTFWNRG